MAGITSTRIKFGLLVAFLLLTFTRGFQATLLRCGSPVRQRRPPSSSVLGASEEDEPVLVVEQSTGPKNVAASFETVAYSISDLNFSKIWGNVDKIIENTMSGTPGARGEIWFALQAFVGVSVVMGQVPYFGDFINFLLGPVLLGVGLLMILLSVSDLGDALSPWPKAPSEEQRNLKTNGVYGLVRHPMYTGLLCTCGGFSVLTNSADRLLLTIVLYIILDYKTKIEEESLLDYYLDEYENYKLLVPGRFFPWMKDEQDQTDIDGYGM